MREATEKTSRGPTTSIISAPSKAAMTIRRGSMAGGVMGPEYGLPAGWPQCHRPLGSGHRVAARASVALHLLELGPVLLARIRVVGARREQHEVERKGRRVKRGSVIRRRGGVGHDLDERHRNDAAVGLLLTQRQRDAGVLTCVRESADEHRSRTNDW